MRRASGYVDGIVSGATWGVVAIMLPGPDRLPGQPLLAMSVAAAALFDSAGAGVLLARAGMRGTFLDVLRVLSSRRVLLVAVCSVLGGPLFMGGYTAAVILAGPSDAVTATATYPVIGAMLASRLLHQRLDRIGWSGVAVTTGGAVMIAVDAGWSDQGARVITGVAVALGAATAVALEGIVATRAMAGMDAMTVMAVRGLLSSAMFGLAVLVVPGTRAAMQAVLMDGELAVRIGVAGIVGGYSYAVWYRAIRRVGVAGGVARPLWCALWGAVLAGALVLAPLTLLAISGCVVVTAGAVVTILSGNEERTGPDLAVRQESTPRGGG